MADLKGGTTIAGLTATHIGNIAEHIKSNGAHKHEVSDIIGLTDGNGSLNIDGLEVHNIAYFHDTINSSSDYFVSPLVGENIQVISRDGTLYYQGMDLDTKFASVGDMDTLSADTTNSIDAIQNVLDDHSMNVATAQILGHVKVGANLKIATDGTLTANEIIFSSSAPPIAGNEGLLWLDTFNNKLHSVINVPFVGKVWSGVSTIGLDDTLTSTSTTSAATANAVKKLNDKIPVLNNTLTSTSTTEAATANAVKLVNDKVLPATTATAGIVQLNATVTSTSSTQAATAYVVKIAYDLANSANNTASLGSQAYTKLFTRNIAIATGAVVGTDSVSIGTNSSANFTDSVALGYGAKTGGNYAMALGSYANASMYNDAYIGVSTSSTGAWHVRIPGNFSVGGSKSFQIEHPKPEKRDTHLIRHGAVESPSTGDTLYRYSIKVQGNIAKVMLFGENKEIELPITEKDGAYSIAIPLPDYFVHLNINEQVFINGDKHFGLGFGEINRAEETLEITLNSLKDYSVMVFGTRDDEGVKDWYIDGVEREVGVSWEGETYNLSDEEILVFDEFVKEEEII